MDDAMQAIKDNISEDDFASKEGFNRDPNDNTRARHEIYDEAKDIYRQANAVMTAERKFLSELKKNDEMHTDARLAIEKGTNKEDWLEKKMKAWKNDYELRAMTES